MDAWTRGHRLSLPARALTAEGTCLSWPAAGGFIPFCEDGAEPLEHKHGDPTPTGPRAHAHWHPPDGGGALSASVAIITAVPHCSRSTTTERGRGRGNRETKSEGSAEGKTWRASPPKPPPTPPTALPLTTARPLASIPCGRCRRSGLRWCAVTAAVVRCGACCETSRGDCLPHEGVFVMCGA